MDKHSSPTTRWSIWTALAGVLLSTIAQADETGTVKVERDLVYAEVDGNALKLDLYLPKTDHPAPLVVWIHGGGWRGGSKKNPKLLKITEHGFALASISYRFTKEAIFPAQIHDCKAAIRWLRAHADQFGYDANWIAVAGSSAGGHLALLMGVSGAVPELEGEVGDHPDQSSSVQAVIDYFGPSDFVLRGKTQPDRAYTEKSGSFALLGGLQGGVTPRMERFASPSSYVSADDPPLLIFQGKEDPVVLPDQSERILSLYTEAGLEAKLILIEKAKHGGKVFFDRKHFRAALHFLNRHRPE
ncbi:Carboxylesterase type B [Planctomycetales bacterium 10988]|nr:Carboxylesterase type B [Planctomycetales bacterium 10988]